MKPHESRAWVLVALFAVFAPVYPAFKMALAAGRNIPAVCAACVWLVAMVLFGLFLADTYWSAGVLMPARFRLMDARYDYDRSASPEDAFQTFALTLEWRDDSGGMVLPLRGVRAAPEDRAYRIAAPDLLRLGGWTLLYWANLIGVPFVSWWFTGW